MPSQKTIAKFKSNYSVKRVKGTTVVKRIAPAKGAIVNRPLKPYGKGGYVALCHKGERIQVLLRDLV